MKKYLYAVVAVVILIGASVLYRLATVETLENVTFIKNGERVCSSDNSCKFLEYASDETFENTDEWIFLKFNSGDVHRLISAGTVCQSVKVYGWRVPFLSWYRNIVSIEGCTK